MPTNQKDDDVPPVSITSAGKSYDLESSVEVEGQRPRNSVGGLSTKEKLRIDISSGSLWNKMFLTVCIIAVCLDPLFFYIPFIKENQKCLAVDKQLKIAALILRGLTDVTFIVHIVYNICKAISAAYKELKRKGGKTELERDWEYSRISRGEIIPFANLVAGKLQWRSTITDVLAVFPMPQLLLVIVFFEMKGNGYLERRKILNVFLLAQYLPRIYRIYLSSKELRHTTGIWAKALLNFFLYILASHVIGAFWYFFSIQRETSCWHRACMKHKKDNITGCISTFYCNSDKIASRNVTFFNQYCPITSDEDAPAPFDFGIFRDALKNNVTGDKGFATKLSYSFWWGLRNISNFGTNLVTSTYVWETCFAVFISLIGLLLFLYFIGNVQTFISMQTQKWEDIRQKMDSKEEAINSWMEENELPDDLKKDIKKNITKKLEENKDADLGNIFSFLFSILPNYTKKCLKRVLCLPTLKRVPGLERMDEKVLKMMCDYLKPAMHDEGFMPFRMGDPLECMLFITEGTLGAYKSYSPFEAENAKSGNSYSQRNLEKGDFHGEELINWAHENVQSKQPTDRPHSAYNVKCNSRVEGFTLAATDLRAVVSRFELLWKLGINSAKANAKNVQPKP